MATNSPEVRDEPRSRPADMTWASNYAWGWVFVAAIVLALAAWAVFRSTSSTPPMPTPAPVQAPIQGDADRDADAPREPIKPIEIPVTP